MALSIPDQKDRMIVSFQETYIPQRTQLPPIHPYTVTRTRDRPTASSSSTSGIHAHQPTPPALWLRANHIRIFLEFVLLSGTEMQAAAGPRTISTTYAHFSARQATLEPLRIPEAHTRSSGSDSAAGGIRRLADACACRFRAESRGIGGFDACVAEAGLTRSWMVPSECCRSSGRGHGWIFHFDAKISGS